MAVGDTDHAASDASEEAASNYERLDFGDVEGKDRPFRPNNARCNAPCPPGSFCNTRACSRKTEYFVQQWTCLWRQTHLKCSEDAQRECAWGKVWRCHFKQIQRCEVLKAFPRAAPRCPDEAGDSQCFVPRDTYFARVWEIDYEPCDYDDLRHGERKDDSDSSEGATGCACCGLAQVVAPRWVKITSRAQMPPDHAYEPPLPWAKGKDQPDERERDARGPRPRCSGALCRVGPNANKSPDFWLAPVFPYA
ncbi:MAG: hypothetical protein EB084_19960 [Proteobacteria bacterium]|nr:hypothetical protein [Pseudomonadota bacterium]